MQSLLSAKTCVGVRSPVVANSEERSTRRTMQSLNCRNSRSWRNVVVSCGSEKNGNDGIGASEGWNSGSFLSPSHNYAILKHRMEVAAKSEVSAIVFFYFFFEKKMDFSCFIIDVAPRCWKEASYWIWNGGSIMKRLQGFVTRSNASRTRFLFCVYGGCWKKLLLTRDFRSIVVFKPIILHIDYYVSKTIFVHVMFQVWCSVLLLMQDAAKYRDQLREIAPHSLLKCSSDSTTLVWMLVTFTNNYFVVSYR